MKELETTFLLPAQLFAFFYLLFRLVVAVEVLVPATRKDSELSLVAFSLINVSPSCFL